MVILLKRTIKINKPYKFKNMKKRIYLLGVFLITINSILAQSFEACNFYPFYATDYIVSGNFSQNNSSDKVINDVVMLRYNNVIDEFKLITLTSDGNGDRTLNENYNFNNYDLANVNGRMVKGDFDNDGHIDDFILIYKTGVFSMRFDLFKSNGAAAPTFTQSTVYTLDGYDPDKITGRVVSGDFDNDGYWDDIAAFYDYGNGETRIHTFRSNGSTFAYSSSVGWWNSTGYTATRVTDRVVSGDFDKDGTVDDIAAFYDYGGGNTRIHVWLSNGSGFTYQSSVGWWVSNPSSDFTASKISKRVLSLNIDRKGENYDDIVTFYKTSSGKTKMRVFISDGTSFDYQPYLWESTSNPDLISGKIVEYDSRTSSFTQGKPSDIIGFSSQYFATQYLFWKAKKGVFNTNIEYSTPYYCESKSSNDDTVIEEISISAYPNPTKSSINIEIPDSLIDSITDIQIHNLFGEIVFSTKVNSSKIHIDLSNKKPGIYLVKLIGGEATNVLKIIKE